MRVPRILLISASPPGEESAGGVYLRKICESYPRGFISSFTVTSPHRFAVASGMEWLPIAFAPSPTVLPLPALKSKPIQLAHLQAWRKTRQTALPSLIKEITIHARDQKTELIWVVLNHPLLFKVAWRVATELDLELVSTVWDPPEYLIRNLGLSPWMARSLQRDFDRTLRKSRICGAISENMAREYKSKYGVPTMTTVHSIEDRLSCQPCSSLQNTGNLIVGFAGSPYASREWEALLRALSESKWIVAGHKVSLVYIGAGNPSGVTADMPVHHVGWKKQAEAIRILSKVDVAYLPYWFDKRFAIATRLSFPSKLSSYAAAGKPVLFHGPADSSVAGFFERYPFGVSCHSLSSQEILRALEKFTDPEFYASVAHVAGLSFSEVFDWGVVRLRFAHLFGLSPDDIV